MYGGIPFHRIFRSNRAKLGLVSDDVLFRIVATDRERCADIGTAFGNHRRIEP